MHAITMHVSAVSDVTTYPLVSTGFCIIPQPLHAIESPSCGKGLASSHLALWRLRPARLHYQRRLGSIGLRAARARTEGGWVTHCDRPCRRTRSGCPRGQFLLRPVFTEASFIEASFY